MSASSSWPTATALNRPRSPETMEKCAAFRKRNANQNTVPIYLEEVAIQWETPSVAVTAGTRLTRGGDRSSELLLSGQAVAAAEHWSTPKASDGEKGGPNMRGSKGDQPLPAQAAHWPDPCSLPDRPTPSGEKSSETRRRLNPLFVEWLMGWPEGLSGFDTAGTASCHSPQPPRGCGCMDCWLTRQREALSKLLTIAPPAQGSLL